MAKPTKPTPPAGPPTARPLPLPRRSNINKLDDDDNTSGDYPGNHLFAATCRPMRMHWPKEVSKAKEAVTTFRLCPEPVVDTADPEAFVGQFHPGRVYDENNQVQHTDWIQRHDTFRIQAMSRDPALRGGAHILINDTPNGTSDGRPKWDTPAWRLRQGIKTGITADRGEDWWNGLVNKEHKSAGERGRRTLKGPNQTYFGYGLIYQHGPEEYDVPLGIDRREPPIVLDLGGMGRGIVAISRLPKDGCAEMIGDGTVPVEEYPDPNMLYEARDPVAVRAGLFFRAFPKDSKSPRPAHRKEVYTRKDKKIEPGIVDVPEDDEEAGFGYRVYACSAYATVYDERRRPTNVITPGIATAYREDLWRKLRTPLSDQLTFLPFEDQVALFCKYLRDPDGGPCLDLLEYVFQEVDEWMAVVRSELGRAARRTTTSAGRGDDARRAVRGSAPPIDEEDEEEEVETRGTARRPAVQHPPVAEHEEEEEETGEESEEEDEIPAAEEDPVDEDEEEEETATPPPAARPSPAAARPVAAPSSKAGKGKVEFEEPPAPAREAASAPSKAAQALSALKDKTGKKGTK